ncbi:ABC transporter permease [Streptomyces sp. ISL-10]|uniref:ABC transporter permease n=1 Tax=Streptomyces sp. ISL-10 TaxID=2819172 RepID=UPI001BEB9FA3|nr:ABC transporter permease [Streptomyces sp. ISL-10]MBT2365570.1 ABC transporter permease [Streptomyces sp. ISL-10]
MTAHDTAPRTAAATAARPRAMAVLWYSMVAQVRQQHILGTVIPGCVVPGALCFATLLAAGENSVLTAGHVQLGCGLLALWSCAIWQTGLILREELWQGTLPGLMVRPSGLGLILFGKTVGIAACCAVLIAATVTGAGVLTGHPLHLAHPLPFTLAALAAFSSALVLGLLLSCLFLLTPAAIRVAEALIYPMSILGGMIIPVTLLPGWLQGVPNIISLRWAAELMIAAADGETQRTGAWLMLLATTACYALATVLAFRLVLHRARKRGTLALS